jgi:hypothetical protein
MLLDDDMDDDLSWTPLPLESMACQWGINGTGEESEAFLLTGQVLVGLGLANPFCGHQHGPRGQYFQFPKSSDFFQFTSLARPLVSSYVSVCLLEAY